MQRHLAVYCKIKQLIFSKKLLVMPVSNLRGCKVKKNKETINKINTFISTLKTTLVEQIANLDLTKTKVSTDDITKLQEKLELWPKIERFFIHSQYQRIHHKRISRTALVVKAEPKAMSVHFW